MVSANKIKAKVNAISTLSNLIAELCVARDFHTIAFWPLERTCWGESAQLEGCKTTTTTTKSRIASFNATFVTTIVISCGYC